MPFFAPISNEGTEFGLPISRACLNRIVQYIVVDENCSSFSYNTLFFFLQCSKLFVFPESTSMLGFHLS